MSTDLAPLIERLDTERVEWKRALLGGQQVIVWFVNGYGASVINDGGRGVELAVLDGDDITYDTPVTNDVLGWLTPETLEQSLREIAALPKRITS